MNIEQHLNKLEDFKNKKILIIGDMMLDKYIWGQVNRISPEAPVPVLSKTGTENRPGGAANVAVNIKSLGAEPILCSVVGNDENGELLTDLLSDQSIETIGIISTPDKITSTKTRLISSNQHLLRIDEEDDSYISPQLEENFIQLIEDLIRQKKPDAIIFQDYDKGMLNCNIIRISISLAKKHGILTLVDPKFRHFLKYRGVDLFKPNLKELYQGMNKRYHEFDLDKIDKLCKELKANIQAEYIMVTMSKHGIYLCNKETAHHLPSQSIEVVDVSGAGDTVIAVSALAMASGIPTPDSAFLANIAGGIVCKSAGVVPVTLPQLKKQLSQIEEQIS